jgi:hypothetical protein
MTHERYMNSNFRIQNKILLKYSHAFQGKEEYYFYKDCITDRKYRNIYSVVLYKKG